jgi:hypothetical protein
MGVRTIEVREYTCDGCNAVQLVPEVEAPKGITGSVFEEDSWGGRSAEFFACSRKCLKAAIETTLENKETSE